MRSPATVGCASRVPSLRAPGRSDELDDETDEGERLGEGDTQEHRGADVAGHFGLAGHRLDGLADEVADADARADGGEAVGGAPEVFAKVIAQEIAIWTRLAKDTGLKLE